MSVNLTPSTTDSPETHAKYAALVRDEKAIARALDDGELWVYRVSTDRAIRNWVEDGNGDPKNDWLRQWAKLRLRIIDETIAWRKSAADRGGAPFETAGWQEYIEAIRERINLPVVMMLTGVALEEKRDGQWWGSCPFHSDKTPSLHVDPALKVFHCFSCGVGGDAFTWAELRRGDTFPEAVRWLGNHYGVQEPKRPTGPPEPTKPKPIWEAFES